MLWPVLDSTISLGGTGPITVSVDQTGRFAYVTVADIGNSTPGIFAFSINPATGMLTPNGSISLPSDVSNSLGLGIVDPSLRDPQFRNLDCSDLEKRSPADES